MGTKATTEQRRRGLAALLASLLLAAPPSAAGRAAACYAVPPGRTRARPRSRGIPPLHPSSLGASTKDTPPPTPPDGDLSSLVRCAVDALVASDRDGDSLTHSYGSESQGLWVHGPSAEVLGDMMGRVQVRRGGRRGRYGLARMRRLRRLGRLGRCRGPRSSDVLGRRCDVSLRMCPGEDVREGGIESVSEVPGDPDSGLVAAEDRALEAVAKMAAETLVQSDVRRSELAGSSSQGRWLHDPGLGRVLDRLAVVSFLLLLVSDFSF